MNQFPDPPYWDQQHQSHSTYPQEFMDHYRKPLKPRHGILVFVIVILLSIFVAAPIQYFFGRLWSARSCSARTCGKSFPSTALV